MTERRPDGPGDTAARAQVAASGSGALAGRVMERGRAKAHRPLPQDVRARAVERGLAAYGRGAWYLAHEELEPAWMGTDDLRERALLSGLIKLAAAYVHAARGNPLGVRTNLLGARERLAAAAAEVTGPAGPPGAPEATAQPGAAAWIDLPPLLAAVDDRLAFVEPLCHRESGPRDGDGDDEAMGNRDPDAASDRDPDAGTEPPSHDVAGPVGRFRGAPVAIARIPLPRRPA